jgi:hypothetical protein
MQLKLYHEIIGDLTDVVTNDGFTKAVFSMIQEVDIPNDKIDIETLRKHIGHRIGLLNIEDEIKIRKIIRKKP